MKTLTSLLLVAFVVFAADDKEKDKVESGPKVDSKVAELKPHFVTGTHEGKEADIPGERKDETTLYFFVNTQKFDRPVFRMMKDVDNKLGETNAKAAGYAVWVGCKEDKEKERVPAISQSAKFAKIDIARMETATPEGWGINDEASLTAVVVKKGKVSKVFAWRSVNEKDSAKVLEAIK